MLPSLEGWGWCDIDGTWKPVWMTLPEEAKACLELLNMVANKNVPAGANVSSQSP